MSKSTVLFLCTGNSARSQMAEALLRHLAEDRFEARSAGLDPRPIHPLTIEVMREVGIELVGQYAKSLGDFLGKVPVRFPIAVCASAERHCPRIWPFGGTMDGWAIDDPAAVQGTGQERLEAFRTARDTIRSRIEKWLSEHQEEEEQ